MTSYGVLAVGGLVSLLLGSMMLVDSPLPELQVGLRLIVPISLAVAGILFVLVRLAVQAQRIDRSPAAPGCSRRRDGRCRRSGRAWSAGSRPMARSGLRRPMCRYMQGTRSGSWP